MKLITEQRRQELIALANVELTEWDLNSDHYSLIEIAMASLTAVPEVSEIESVHPENGNTIIHLRRGGLKNISPEDIAEYEMIETEKFYTAPPVPVIKFPDELTDLVNAVDFYKAVKADNPKVETGAWKDADEWIKKAAVTAAPLIKHLNGIEQ